MLTLCINGLAAFSYNGGYNWKVSGIPFDEYQKEVCYLKHFEEWKQHNYLQHLELQEDEEDQPFMTMEEWLTYVEWKGASSKWQPKNEEAYNKIMNYNAASVAA